jgi:hypothetical protein
MRPCYYRILASFNQISPRNTCIWTWSASFAPDFFLHRLYVWSISREIPDSAQSNHRRRTPPPSLSRRHGDARGGSTIAAAPPSAAVGCPSPNLSLADSSKGRRRPRRPHGGRPRAGGLPGRRHPALGRPERRARELVQRPALGRRARAPGCTGHRRQRLDAC